MDGEDPAETSRDARLNEVLAEYLELREQGSAPDLSTWLKAYPEFREELPEILRQFAELSPLKAIYLPERQTAGLPQRLDDFEFVREVGRGGMGVVFEARQVSLGRRVALKMLPSWALMDHRHVQRFQNESRAAARLQHPHIVPIHAVGCQEGTHYFAMQFIDGCSLKQALDDLRAREGVRADVVEEDASEKTSGGSGSGQHLSSTRGARYFRAVAEIGAAAAEAIEHAHQCGVIHRDVKPANLLLEQNGHLWVADFGLAAIQGIDSLTETGDLLGTLSYMSPEQAASDGRRVDERTDVYSLGMTLYELVALRPAFIAKDRRSLLRQVLNEEPVPPSQFRPRIPRDLETIIIKAIAKSPEDRYSSALALAQDLRNYLAGAPILATRPGLTKRATRWSRSHAGLLSVLLLTTLAATAALASTSLYLLNSSRGSRASRATVPWDAKPLTLSEGSSYSVDALRFAGEDIEQATHVRIDWGDGVQQEYALDVVAKHDYADGPAEHAFRLELFRAATRLGSRERTIKVEDVPPVIDVRWPDEAIVDEGVKIKLARPHDPGKDVIVRCRVDWGDTATGDYLPPAEPIHTFTSPMTTTVQVFAEDDDGSHLVAAKVYEARVAAVVGEPQVVSPNWKLARRYTFDHGMGGFLHPLDGKIYVIRRFRENHDGEVKDAELLGLFQIDEDGATRRIFNAFFINFAAPHPVTGDIFVQFANPCKYVKLSYGTWEEKTWATEIRKGDTDPCGFLITPRDFHGETTSALRAVIADRGVDSPKDVLCFSVEAPQKGKVRLHKDNHVLFDPLDVAASATEVYIADAAGGGDQTGRLFRLQPGGALTAIEPRGNIGQPAGIAATRDNRTLYIADMRDRRLLQMDLTTGAFKEIVRDLEIREGKAAHRLLAAGCVRLSDDERTLVVTDRGHAAVFLFERQ